MNQLLRLASMRFLFLSLFFTFLTSPFVGFGQIGGLSTYNFLNLTPAARITAMGGAATATYDQDVNLAYYNPAMLGKDVHQRLGMSIVNYIADINYGNVTYAHHHSDKVGTFAGSINYINYGKLEGRDEAGNSVGAFSANELALQLGWGKEINHMMRIGANFKMIGSYLESYTSHGIGIDMSAMYIDTANNLVASLLIRNFGSQIQTYVPGEQLQMLPLDVQLALTNKLRYVPFRWGVIVHNLHRWNLRYFDPNDVYYRPRILLNEGEEDPALEKRGIGDEIARHIILNGELLLSKNFHVRIGYNHQRRRELVVPTRNGASGFSWGFGMQIKRFRFDYGSGALTMAGTSNNFSITTNLGDW